MYIKLKHFYYNETENAMVFVKQVETRQDGVDVVKCSYVNSDRNARDIEFSYNANTFLDRYKLVGFLTEE